MAFQFAITQLQAGRGCMITPKGHSMEPLVKSGQKVLLFPYGSYQSKADPEVGDIVLVKVKGSVYLHLISAIDGDRIQISNNKGHVNGWTIRSKVYGVMVK